MDERPVILNELAQGLWSLASDIAWFETLISDEQFEVLCELAGCCLQACVVSEDGEGGPESIRRAGIRPSHTPAVLVTPAGARATSNNH